MTNILPDSIRDALRHVSLSTLTGELGALYEFIVHLVENIPPPSTAPGHEGRKETVDRILGNIGFALARFATSLGIREHKDVTAFLCALKPWVRALVVGLGDINEKYPYLFPVLALTIVVLLLPESFILKPVLDLIGFGVLGPVKGSIAALAQGTFFGGAVPAGCWFAGFQAAGMGVVPIGLGLLAKVSLITGGLFAIKHHVSAT